MSAIAATASAQPPLDFLFRRRAAETVVSTTPHPAIARITVPDKDGISFGTGSLVDARGGFGLVITNWHVIRDAAGEIVVEFPGGFRTPVKRVLKVDRDWDLAALEIARPPAEPLPISPAMPRPGENLVITGYGAGSYRAVAGRCTGYVAPDQNFPMEMIEVSAEARQGDSGGPILNERGEIAGVLFGAATESTAGSYGGRVLSFLASIVPEGRPGSDRPGGIASPGALAQSTPHGKAGHADQPRSSLAPLAQKSAPRDPFAAILMHPADQLEAMSLQPAEAARQAANPAAAPSAASTPANALPQEDERLVAIPRRETPPEHIEVSQVPDATAEVAAARQTDDRQVASNATAPGDPLAEIAPAQGPPLEPASLTPRKEALARAPAASGTPTEQLLLAAWRQIGGTTFYEQAKTVFALIGVLSVVVLVFRLSGRSEEPIEAD